MHLNFSELQILWTLTVAALLVLLIVLLGRHRERRFPWFTTLIGLMALRYLTSRLLYSRIPRVDSDEFFLGLANVAAIVALLVLVEIARQAFAGASRRQWIAGTLALLAVSGVVLGLWGPWPSRSTLFPASGFSALPLMDLIADKGLVLFGALFVQLGVLVLIFGRKFKPGWHSHAQQLAIGFSIEYFLQLSVEATSLHLETHAASYTPDALKRATEGFHSLMTASSIMLLVVLAWWIVCFWNDEPATETADGK